MRRALLLVSLAIAAVLAAALRLGEYPVAFSDVLRLLAGQETLDPAAGMIVRDLRLPRAVLAFLVGVTLGVAGSITQAVLRNPLADPGLLGINSGAALAAMIVIVQIDGTAPHWLPLAAFLGAGAMALAVYVLSFNGGTSSMRVVLIGIGLSSLAGAGASFIAAFGDITSVQRAMLWLSGSFHDATWIKIRTLALTIVVPLVLAFLAARELDTIRFDDDTAHSIGMRVEWVRGLMILLFALLSAGAVAAAGPIGFIGLLAPHLARAAVGHAHAKSLPLAALGGGLLVMVADLVGRTVIAPVELPAGLTVALIGAPFFGVLMWRRTHGRT